MTTILEALGILLIAVGVFVMAGFGPAAVVVGVALLAMSYRITRNDDDDTPEGEG